MTRIFLLFFLSAGSVVLDAQPEINTNDLHGLQYRCIGPSRGGRVTAVAGVPSELFTFYMGATGGGVWKTTDAGTSWRNISDGYFKVGSVGAIAVAPSDPNVVYVGTGSAEPRGNVSIGNGVYRSTDAGETWKYIGLEKAGLIGKVIVHPQDPDRAFVAVLGNIFGPNPERGVYRTTDGGETWKKVHFVSERTGAIDLAMHPENPRILFAAMWTAERKPWTLIDGSEEGGIWKTTDGGDTWTKVKGGLPEGLVGKTGLAISPVNGDRIWAQIETAEEEKGGLYRSDDGGRTWDRINRDHNLRQRAWYYNRIVADPQDENTLYNMNVRFWKSIDGGKNFSSIRTPHGDNHALWINPHRTEIMIEGNDGGACVTLNGGDTWSTLNNQPTAEFYRVTVDNQFPYRVFGAQQDNSTISISSMGPDGLTPYQDWYSVGGGESGHIAVDPRNPDIVYAGNYIGQITYLDRGKGFTKNIVAYPQMHDGVAPRDIKYRFQWNAPIRISPHDPDVLYHCSQFVHRSRDKGQTWETISPDLTTNNDAWQDIPGGPVQHDHTGVELYTTIFAFEESPIEPGVLWAGSDDGLIHISRDNGETWENRTPRGMPAGGTVNAIDVSVHANGRAIATVFRYREDDFRPHVFLTDNFGKDWKLLTDGKNGIPENHFVRVTREDPENKGLLYAGTEFGMYISFDEGKHWHAFQQNLPVVPVTDMLVKEDDLVIATQGRSFWILDGLDALRAYPEVRALSDISLLPPENAVRTQYRANRGAPGIDRAPDGATMTVYVPEGISSDSLVTLRIRDPEGRVRRTFSTSPDKDKKEEKLKLKEGLNTVSWDLRYEKPEILDDAFFSLASTYGIKALPGVHQVELVMGDKVIAQPLEVVLDPRWDQPVENLFSQYALTMKAKELLEEIHASIRRIRKARKQIRALIPRFESMQEGDELKKEADRLVKWLTKQEEMLIQTKSESGQDPINYPPMLDDQAAYLYSLLNRQDDKPNEGAFERFADLEDEWATHRENIRVFFEKDIKIYNETLEQAGMTHIFMKVIRP